MWAGSVSVIVTITGTDEIAANSDITASAPYSAHLLCECPITQKHGKIESTSRTAGTIITGLRPKRSDSQPLSASKRHRHAAVDDDEA